MDCSWSEIRATTLLMAQSYITVLPLAMPSGTAHVLHVLRLAAVRAVQEGAPVQQLWLERPALWSPLELPALWWHPVLHLAGQWPCPAGPQRQRQVGEAWERLSFTAKSLLRAPLINLNE
eukprot:1149865-Pelagomonas_calceolata.AAC.5